LTVNGYLREIIPDDAGNWPSAIRSLLNSSSLMNFQLPQVFLTVEPEQGSEIYILGWTKPLEWKYNKATGLEISLPAELQDESKRPCKITWSFSIAAFN
jgi:hypothetical protein